MNNSKLNMIVCVAKDNLIGDKNPEGNGLLWHSKEELAYYKEKTIGNIVVFGKNTAKYIPIELMKKNREVIIISSKDNFEEILKKYENSGKDIFICGGATVYKAYLEKYTFDNIYISVLKPHIEVKTPISPLYFPEVKNLGYKVIETREFNDFIAYTYQKIK